MDRRRGLLFNKARLPKGYTECKYLQSNGNQYIYSGLRTANYNSGKIAFEIVASFANTGKRQLNGANNGRFFGLYNNNSFELLGKPTSIYNVQNKFYKIKYSYDLSLDTDNVILCVGEDELTSYRSPTYEDHVIVLFSMGDKNSASSTYNCRMKCKEFIIGDGTTIDREFIPCIDGSNKPCMYDLITKQPFYNNGSGEFGYETLNGTYVAPV